MSDVLWQPGADANNSAMARFRAQAEIAAAQSLPDYASLHAWSIADRPAFWRLLWQFANVRGTPGLAALADDTLPGARWFPDGTLNFTDNLLVKQDASPALIWRDETGKRDELSWQTLNDRVNRTAAALAAQGIGLGDRIAAIVPNRIETVVLALATAQVGAVWSSCSADFGAQAIIDRFAQLKPMVLIGCGGYHFNGRWFDCLPRFAEVRAALPTVRITVLIDAPQRTSDLGDALDANSLWESSADRANDAPGHDPGHDPRRAPRRGFPFATPLYILFSSGTTGMPKCIVHGAGGTLLKHRSEQLLHGDFRDNERVLFFTTCGWMMWNWLISALAGGTTVCLYDGAPLHPDPGVLLRYVEEEHVDHFGISPGYLSQLAKLNYSPRTQHDLSGLRSVLSTGSPLAAELFRWHYAHLQPTARLASITGGTDLIGCFALGNPLLPVHAGEIQCAALGMDIAFVDDAGHELPAHTLPAHTLPAHTQGELVCRRSFPSVPLGFLDDIEGRRFHDAYFDRYPGMWHHGDFGELTAHNGVIIHGRSDATLNRAGVRIGTAEIYRQLEAIPEIVEAIAVTQERGADLRMVLFVRMQTGNELSADLESRVRNTLRQNASPRHVPDVIVAVPDLPRTRSGKLAELAVRELIHGRTVRNIGALANPECLDHFKDHPALE